jgi:hypothetical protein|nr:MAG TPA: Stage VI sporulation protein F [Caudoviricetes sp.]
MKRNNYYLGRIKYRTNVNWNEVNKLIQAETIQEAEKKLREWANKNMSTEQFLITVTETL